MNSSIDHQIVLLLKLIKELNSCTEQLNENTVKYEKYVTALENNGLFTNSVKRLRDTYFVNTKSRLDKISSKIQEKDIPDVKRLIIKLQKIKSIMEQ